MKAITAFQKKKLVDTAKAVAFRSLSVVELKEEGRQTTDDRRRTTENVQPETLPATAKLVIEEEVRKPVTAVAAETPVPQPKSAGLGRIRARVLEEHLQSKPLLALSDHELKTAWAIYTVKLDEEKKHPSASAFRGVKLNIETDNDFIVVTEGSLQARFIETERAGLIHFLQAHFNNPLLKYTIEKIETETAAEEGEKKLSGREQYRLMVEKYPLVKEFKDRLKLEIDY